MSPDTPMIASVGQIHVNVRDLDRAVAFYRDVLGLHFLFQPPGMAFFDCGGVRLMLGPAEKPEFDHPASIVYYKTADIESAHAALESHGVTVEHAPRFVAPMPDHDLWMAFYKDSEENFFALMCEKAKEDR
jgi:predicted enzyme related to lactoylglutathione lyase